MIGAILNNANYYTVETNLMTLLATENCILGESFEDLVQQIEDLHPAPLHHTKLSTNDRKNAIYIDARPTFTGDTYEDALKALEEIDELTGVTIVIPTEDIIASSANIEFLKDGVYYNSYSKVMRKDAVGYEKALANTQRSKTYKEKKKQREEELKKLKEELRVFENCIVFILNSRYQLVREYEDNIRFLCFGTPNFPCPMSMTNLIDKSFFALNMNYRACKEFIKLETKNLRLGVYGNVHTVPMPETVLVKLEFGKNLAQTKEHRGIYNKVERLIKEEQRLYEEYKAIKL